MQAQAADQKPLTESTNSAAIYAGEMADRPVRVDGQGVTQSADFLMHTEDSIKVDVKSIALTQEKSANKQTDSQISMPSVIVGKEFVFIGEKLQHSAKGGDTTSRTGKAADTAHFDQSQAQTVPVDSSFDQTIPKKGQSAMECYDPLPTNKDLNNGQNA